MVQLCQKPAHTYVQLTELLMVLGLLLGLLLGPLLGLMLGRLLGLLLRLLLGQLLGLLLRLLLGLLLALMLMILLVLVHQSVLVLLQNCHCCHCWWLYCHKNGCSCWCHCNSYDKLLLVLLQLHQSLDERKGQLQQQDQPSPCLGGLLPPLPLRGGPQLQDMKVCVALHSVQCSNTTHSTVTQCTVQ